MKQSNEAREPLRLSLRSGAQESQLPSPHAATTEVQVPRALGAQEKASQGEACEPHLECSPQSPTREKPEQQ